MAKAIKPAIAAARQKGWLIACLLFWWLIWIAVWYWPHSNAFQSFFDARYSPSEGYVIKMIATFLSLAALMTGFLAILTKRERVKDWRQFFGIERLDIKGIWLCLGAGVLVQALNAAFLWKFILNPTRDFLATHGLGGPLIGLGSGSTVPLLSPLLATFLTVFMLVFWWLEAPEEMFFRGYLQRGFQAIVGENKAAVISALIWDLAHVWGLVNIIERFLYGLIYGFIYRFRQNTTPTMIVHPLGNRALILSVTIPQIWGVSINPTSTVGILLLLGIYVALITLVIVFWKLFHLDRTSSAEHETQHFIEETQR